MLERVISGGQAGVDQAGWRAAKTVGLACSGWMPRGFRTEDGSYPEFAAMYGAQETPTADYRERTEWNVRDSDVTVWLGLTGSPGWHVTERACRGLNKEMFLVIPGQGIRPSDLAERIVTRRVRVLNVAGRRESGVPGIGERAERFLIEVFRMVLAMSEKPPSEVMRTGWYPEPF
jgi:hypothetical protein